MQTQVDKIIVSAKWSSFFKIMRLRAVQQWIINWQLTDHPRYASIFASSREHLIRRIASNWFSRIDERPRIVESSDDNFGSLGIHTGTAYSSRVPSSTTAVGIHLALHDSVMSLSACILIHESTITFVVAKLFGKAVFGYSYCLDLWTSSRWVFMLKRLLRTVSVVRMYLRSC